MINELLTLFEKDLKTCWEKIKTIVKPDDWFFLDKYQYIEKAYQSDPANFSGLVQVRLRIKLIIEDMRLIAQNQGGGATAVCKGCGAEFPKRSCKDYCSDCSYKRNVNRRILRLNKRLKEWFNA